MKRRLTTMALKTATILIAGLLLSTVVHAENKALERAQFMLRQINSQKVQLENQNAALKTELDSLRKESKKKLKQQKAGNKKLGAAARKKEGHITKLREKLKQTLIALRKSEQERLQANSMGIAIDTEMKQCASNNHKLVQMNDRLIDNYKNKSCWDSVVQNEPFTGINQVEIENILQKYRFANEDYKVKQNTEYVQKGGSVSVVPEENNSGS